MPLSIGKNNGKPKEESGGGVGERERERGTDLLVSVGRWHIGFSEDPVGVGVTEYCTHDVS